MKEPTLPVPIIGEPMPLDLTGFPNTGSFYGEHIVGVGEVDWGNGRIHHRHTIEVVAMFDHDYLGVHFLLQVWDHRHQVDPDLNWQYVLALHAPRNGEWTTWVVADFGYDHDCLVRAAQHVDAWRKAPSCLRFILE